MFSLPDWFNPIKHSQTTALLLPLAACTALSALSVAPAQAGSIVINGSGVYVGSHQRVNRNVQVVNGAPPVYNSPNDLPSSGYRGNYGSNYGRYPYYPSYPQRYNPYYGYPPYYGAPIVNVRVRKVPYGGSSSIDNATLINPTIINSEVRDSNLINPVIVNPNGYYPNNYYRGTRQNGSVYQDGNVYIYTIPQN